MKWISTELGLRRTSLIAINFYSDFLSDADGEMENSKDDK